MSVAEWSNDKGEPAQITVGGKLLKTGLLLQELTASAEIVTEVTDPVIPGFNILVIDPFRQHL